MGFSELFCIICCLAVSGLCKSSFPYDIVDLSRDLDENSLFWPKFIGFEKNVETRGTHLNGVWVFSNKLQMTEHVGTHLDAPSHVYEFGWNVDQIPINHMIGPGVIINVKDKAKKDPDYRVSQSDLDQWEEMYGEIPEGAAVIMNSGWHEKYKDKKQVFGSETPDNTSTFHFPGWHEDAVYWLINSRHIHIIGVDVPSIDYGKSTTFPVHVLFCKENIVGLENVAYLDKIPPSGTIISAAAMKTKGGSGSPTRIYAMVPKEMTNVSTKSRFSLVSLIFGIVLTIIFHV